jgi:hypothetical protein
MIKYKRSDVRVPRFSRFGAVGVVILCGGIVLGVGGRSRAEEGDDFNQPGHIVIADQFNNRVIEIDPETHKIVWQFGDGSSVPGPNSIVGTNDAERFGDRCRAARRLPRR